MMPKVVESSAPKNVSHIPSQGLDNQGPAPLRKRSSSMVGQHGGVNDDVKIDISGPLITNISGPLITKQKKTKWLESNRRYDRIVDIAKMLEDNEALSKPERKWLVDLGKNHYEQYCQLGDLLRVSKLGRPGQHGVWRVEDRNKIRMQTMKAALHEAMKPLDPQASDQEKENAINRALEAARMTRTAMTKNMGIMKNLNAYNNLKAYEDVTKESLHKPSVFYEKYNRKLANALLYRVVRPPRDIHSDISLRDQKRAAKAVAFLVDNDLLDTKAALRLRSALTKGSPMVSDMLSSKQLVPHFPMQELEVKPGAEREKVRALSLLALAYNKTDVAKKKQSGLMTVTTEGGKELGPNDVFPEVKPLRHKPRFRWLPDLPPPGRRASQQDRDKWIAWAKPKPDQSIVIDNKADIDIVSDPKMEKEINIVSKPNVEKDDDDLSNVIVEEEPKKESKPNAKEITGSELKSEADSTDNDGNGQNLAGGNADGGNDDYSLKPLPKKQKIVLGDDNASNDDTKETKEDVGGDKIDDSHLSESIVDENPLDKNKAGQIPQELAAELQEKKKDIDQPIKTTQPTQPNQFKLLDQDLDQDNRGRTDSTGSSKSILSSMGSSGGDQTTHIRNQTTIIHKTTEDDVSDNDKELDDLYTSDSDDNGEPVDETKVTEAEEIKHAAKIQEKTVNTEDKTDKESPPQSLSFGDLIDETGKEKSRSQMGGPSSPSAPVQKLPVVLELNPDNNDDNKLIDAMKALGAQKWPKEPLGSNPFSKPSETFKNASSSLFEQMSSLNLAINSWFDSRKIVSDAPLTIAPGIRIAIATARNDATAARDELESLRNDLNASNVSNQDPNYGRHEAFKKKVATAIDQLDAIIQHTDLMLDRVKRAEQEKSESLKYSEDDNNNNNNVQ